MGFGKALVSSETKFPRPRESQILEVLDARGAVGPRHDIERILDAGEAAELAIAKLRQQGQETLVQQQVMYNKLRKFTDNPWVLTRSETNWSYLEIISRIHKKNFYEIIECFSSSLERGARIERSHI